MRVSRIILSIVGLALALSAAAEEPLITTTRLNDHLFMLSTDQGSYTTNSLVSVGDDGVLLVDTQASDVAEEFKSVVESFGKGAPAIIINTHRHVEHVGGNAMWGTGPIIIAHHLVRTKLRSGAYLFEEFPEATLPDIGFSGSMTLCFNGERIELTEMAGSHDDNEIIVHFTDNKVVHLSSLVNGFNFPSVDSDGDALAFPEVVGRAIELLPEDVTIVSGHNGPGTMDDMRAYLDMLERTIAVVRGGVAAGKDAAALKQEKVLEQWESYAGSYVSSDEWIDYLVKALESRGQEPKPSVFEPLYNAMKQGGVDAVLTRYAELKRDHADDFEFSEVDLLVVGDKLLTKERADEAATVFEAAVGYYPDAKYTFYLYFLLAQALDASGQPQPAVEACRKGLELQPESKGLKALLERLELEQSE